MLHFPNQQHYLNEIICRASSWHFNFPLVFIIYILLREREKLRTGREVNGESFDELSQNSKWESKTI